ncbi:MAG: nicotinate-nucleotide adenylyltransferase [Verrucomicrobiota bacterium]|nr:nicotinate-nucleotide adenylyltransferase [Verrucomicrobiota bacterium]
MIKTIIFGGTFDPVHNGHIGMASDLINSGIAEEIIFLPTWSPPHKTNLKITLFQHRFKMLKLATKDLKNCIVSDFELQEKQEPSYSINTIYKLKKKYPAKKLYFLMGLDSLHELHTWYKADIFIKENDFIIFNRPGLSFPSVTLLTRQFSEESAKKLLSSVVKITEYPISSTEIRQKLALKKKISTLLPISVLNYIKTNKLYLESTT